LKLDTGEPVFADFLRRISSSNNERSFIESSFPEKLLLQYALSTSEYWAQKAVEWMMHKPALVRELFNDLKQIPADKRFSQSLRHTVQGLLVRNK